MAVSDKDVTQDINNAVATVESAEKDVVIPDKVTVSVGKTGYSATIDTTGVSKIKAYLPYFVVVVWWLITVLANQFNWTIPFTNQQFTNWLTLGLSLVITVYTTWKDNPVTDSSNYIHSIGEAVLDAFTKINVLKNTAEETSTEEPTTVETSESPTTVAPEKKE